MFVTRACSCRQSTGCIVIIDHASVGTTCTTTRSSDVFSCQTTS